MQYVALYLLAFWYVYILVMGLYRAWLAKRLKGFVLIAALPAVLVGYAMDVASNVSIASVIFLELPREWLVTDRLKRYIATCPETWRGRLASRICESLLDVFDPSGSHCKPA